MAQLALALGGSLLGSAVGIGGSWGWLIGSVVGSLLFPQKGQDVEGPRLGDLSVQSSAYGAPRARGWGTVRMAGNVIWAKEIEEIKKTESVGGKGGMGSEGSYTSYEYFGTWAPAYGAGPCAEIIRLWANKKLVYDKWDHGAASAGFSRGNLSESFNRAVGKPNQKFRFYKGTGHQLADASIVADKGAARTPAFRNTIYQVNVRWPLGDYGNVVPTIEAEIAYESDGARFSLEGVQSDGSTPITGLQSQNVPGIDWQRGRMFALDINTAGDPADTFMLYAKTGLMREQATYSASQLLGQNVQVTAFNTNGLHVAGDGSVIHCANGAGGGNSEPIVRLHRDTLRECGRFGDASSQTANDETAFGVSDKYANISLIGPGGTLHYVLVGNENRAGFGVLALGPSTGLEYLWDSDTQFIDGVQGARVKSVAPGFVAEGHGNGYALLGPSYSVASTASLFLYNVHVDFSAAYVPLSPTIGVSVSELEIAPATLLPGATTFANAGEFLWFDPVDQKLITHVENDADGKHWIIKFDPATGVVAWRTEVGHGPNVGRGTSQARMGFGTIGFIGEGTPDVGYMLDTATGELIVDGVTFNPDVAIAVGAPGVWDSKTSSFIGITSGGNIARWYFDRVTAGPVSLGQYVRDVSELCDLDPLLDVVTTDIDPIEVRGILLGRETTGRAAIDPFANAYLFDAVESDWVIKYVERGQSSARTLTQEGDLVRLDNNGEILRVSRIQEPELPMRVSIGYMDQDIDYQPNVQSWKRIVEPTPSMSSVHQITIALPVVDLTERMKKQAQKIGVSSWVERDIVEFHTHWGNVDLDPTDVVTILVDDGTIYSQRIVEFNIGADLKIEANSVSQEEAQFVSNLDGYLGEGVPPQTVPQGAPIVTFILDVPLLRDSDEPAGRSSLPTYFFMSGYEDGEFTRGVLFKSPEGTIWEGVGIGTVEAAWGACINALGDPPLDDPFTPDMTNTLTVQMEVGEDLMVTVTELEWLNEANSAAIIKEDGTVEVIGFRDVTDNGDGTFTLSRLLRGRRGTDTMCFDHTEGSRFLLLDVSTGQKFTLQLSELDASRLYKGVSPGQLLEDASTEGLTSEGRCLMPYHPAEQEADINTGTNDITLTATRRTRVGGAWVDGFGTVPLSEDEEEYELEIYDGPGGTLVRTVTGLATPSYVYTSANQVTDGFSPPLAAITVKWYQISAQVGRGFSREKTLIPF